MSHVRVTDTPTTPPAGWMSVTFVGVGASTAVPVIGHVDRDCACRDAIARAHSRNRRNNVSLLLTLPCAGATAAAASASSCGDADTRSSSNSSDNDIDGSGRALHVTAVNTPCNNVAVSTTRRTPTSHADFGGAASASGAASAAAAVRPPVKHVLIDCGKTFRDAYFGVLLRHGVCRVDALLLTHDHADAMGGLDDLRDVQPMRMMSNGHWYIDAHIPTYLTATTLRTLRARVGYVVRNSQLIGSAPADAMAHARLLADYAAALEQQQQQQQKQQQQRVLRDEGDDMALPLVGQDIGIRRSTALQFFVLPDDVPTRFYVDAVHASTSSTTTMTAVTQATTNNDSSSRNAFAMYAVPVEHGKDYMCLGFVFGRGVARRSEGGSSGDAAASGSCVVYLSDVSALPPAADAFLRDLVKIDVLIVDMLAEHGAHSVIHYCMDDLMPLLRRLTPARTYCVGMFCSVEHDDGNATWQADLAAERQRLRDVLARHQKSSSNSNNSNDNDDDEEVRAARRFLHTVQSVELAYDGMDLHLPW